MSAPRKIQAAAWMAVLGLCLLVVSGCGDSSGPGNGGGDLVSQQIGPEGGTVRTPDGQLTLIFPAGAVTQTQTITIEPLEPSQVGGEFAPAEVERAYDLGPNGLTFQQPVTVSVPSEAQVVQPDGGLELSAGLLLTSSSGVAEGLEQMRVESVDDAPVLRGELSHFSPLLKTRQRMILVVDGIPDKASVGEEFVAQISARANRFAIDIARYRDMEESGLPVRPLNAPTGRVQLQQSGEEFIGAVTYFCSEEGIGRYVGTVEAILAQWRELRNPFVQLSVSKSVECTEVAERTLSVTKTGSGTGTVTSNPPGIECGEGTDACGESYALGASVALTATPDAGSVFVTWSGACPAGSNVTTVVMDADKTCNAQFDREATIIDQVGSLDLNHGLEAAALPLATSGPANATIVLTLGLRSSGALDVIDFTNRAAPTFNPSTAQSCPGAHSVFFVDFFGAPNPIWLALRETPASTCIGEVPLGAPEVAALSGAPAEGVAIPNTHDVAIGLRFPQEAVLQLSHFGQTPRPSEGIRLAEGACPDGIAATSQKVFVVLTRSPGGTPDAGCTVNGVAVVDLASRGVNVVPMDDTPRDITLSPNGGTAHITTTSGFRWTFDPTTGLATRVGETNYGPVFSIRPLDNSSLGVANGNTNTLHILDAASGDEITNVPSGGVGPIDILMAQDGRTVIVPHSDGKVVFFEYTPQ